MEGYLDLESHRNTRIVQERLGRDCDILVILGHPHPGNFNHAIADAVCNKRTVLHSDGISIMM